jgi:hypothetical protein
VTSAKARVAENIVSSVGIRVMIVGDLYPAVECPKLAGYCLARRTAGDPITVRGWMRD